MNTEQIIPYYNTDHGPELFPRRRRFTSAEKEWRKEAISFVWNQLEEGSALSATKILENYQTIGNRSDDVPIDEREVKKNLKREIREELTEILRTLRIINAILKVQYQSPNWGNQPHIIDELVYILLSRRSKIEDTQEHFQNIKAKYSTWKGVAFAPAEELKELIMGGGLEDDKTRFIQSSLQIIYEQFGRISEDDLSRMSEDELSEFLLELPGIGPKSAACILLYSLDADVFPADTHCIRVLDRLGLFRPLGFSWNQANHKQADRDLAKLIPPYMRGDLHRNLLALGREVCKPQNPLCNQCELKKFCTHFRDERQQEDMNPGRPTAIDMFCGAGGFSVGLRRAGFKIVAAIDDNPDAIRTYRLNHPDLADEALIEGDARRISTAELRRLLDDEELDLLVGGPPCQGYSMVGNRIPRKVKDGEGKFGADYKFSEDERNHLFEDIVRVARALEPRYVVIENVPGITSAEIETKSYAEYISDRLSEAGYRTEVVCLEAANFGIPQRRYRFFIFGIRNEEPELALESLTNMTPAEGEQTLLKHALYDLPPLLTADGKWIMAHQDSRDQNPELYEPYLGRFNIRGVTRILYNHVTRYNNEDDCTLYANLRQGETYRQLAERLEIEEGERPDFLRYSTEHFHDKYYRLEWDGPSKTIVAHLKKDGNSFVHPTQTRSISVREAARIQSFPDEFIFCGSRGSQFIQIGNAVPPVLAEAIGTIVIGAIRDSTEDTQ